MNDFAALMIGTALVRVTSEVFITVLAKTQVPLVVTGKGGLISKKYQYLTSYKGISFYSQSSEALELPAGSEIVFADALWLPEARL